MLHFSVTFAVNDYIAGRYYLNFIFFASSGECIACVCHYSYLGHFKPPVFALNILNNN